MHFCTYLPTAQYIQLYHKPSFLSFPLHSYTPLQFLFHPFSSLQLRLLSPRLSPSQRQKFLWWRNHRLWQPLPQHAHNVSLLLDIITPIQTHHPPDTIQSHTPIQYPIDSSLSRPIPLIPLPVNPLPFDSLPIRIIPRPVSRRPPANRLMECGERGGQDPGLAERGEEGRGDIWKEGFWAGAGGIIDYRAEWGVWFESL